MFGIGSTELLVILIVALIVLGPKSIPKLASTLGKAMGEFRRVSTEFQRTLNAEAAQEEYEKKRQQEKTSPQQQCPATPSDSGASTTASCPETTPKRPENPASSPAETTSGVKAGEQA